MDTTTYKIVFNGKISEGQTIEQVKKILVKFFKTQESQIDKLFTGQTYELQTGIDYQTALKYKEQFEKSGAVCTIEALLAEEQETSAYQGKTEQIPSSQEQNTQSTPQAQEQPETRHKHAKGSYAVINYLISVSVRTLFFLYPLPLHILYQFLEKYHIPITGYIPSFMPARLPLGLTILMIGTILGGVLDILFPNYVLGGKIAVKAFNVGTLYWFKGVGFRLDVDTTGKGIAVKEQKE